MNYYKFISNSDIIPTIFDVKNFRSDNWPFRISTKTNKTMNASPSNAEYGQPNEASTKYREWDQESLDHWLLITNMHKETLTKQSINFVNMTPKSVMENNPRALPLAYKIWKSNICVFSDFVIEN